MNSVTAAMDELARARKELSTWLYKGVTGSRVHERVAQLVDDHQTAVKDVHAHQLAEQIREAGSHLGHNTNLAYRRAAGLIDPRVSQHCDSERPARATSQTQAALQIWPLQRVLTEVRCGSQDWTWESEWADLDDNHADRLAELQGQIEADGITTPVLIGDDGRLWDGHHRLRIATRLNIPYVPVEFTGQGHTTSVPDDALHGLVRVAMWVSRGRSAAFTPDPSPLIGKAYPDATARRALGLLDDAGLLEQYRQTNPGEQKTRPTPFECSPGNRCNACAVCWS